MAMPELHVWRGDERGDCYRIEMRDDFGTVDLSNVVEKLATIDDGQEPFPVAVLTMRVRLVTHPEEGSGR